MEHTSEYKLYVTSKTKIQLEEAWLEDLHTKKDYELSGECITEIKFGIRIEILDEQKANAYLKTTVLLTKKGLEDPGVVIDVVYKGYLRSNEKLDKQSFENWIEPQVIPQLLPYTRVLISNITNLMGVSAVNLPTIDILNTIKLNDHQDSQDGVDTVE